MQLIVAADAVHLPSVRRDAAVATCAGATSVPRSSSSSSMEAGGRSGSDTDMPDVDDGFGGSDTAGYAAGDAHGQHFNGAMDAPTGSEPHPSAALGTWEEVRARPGGRPAQPAVPPCRHLAWVLARWYDHSTSPTARCSPSTAGRLTVMLLAAGRVTVTKRDHAAAATSRRHPIREFSAAGKLIAVPEPLCIRCFCSSCH